MELRHIYALASSIKNCIMEESARGDILKNITVNVAVSAPTHYGIDKEFYRLTHNGSTEGFVHNDNQMAVQIDGVNFHIMSAEESQT